MNKESRTTDIAAKPCEDYDWCEGQLHNHDEAETCHARRQFFVDNTIEVAIEAWGSDPRIRVYVNGNHIEWGEQFRNHDEVFADAPTALERVAEYRRLADALEAATREADAANRGLQDLPC